MNPSQLTQMYLPKRKGRRRKMIYWIYSIKFLPRAPPSTLSSQKVFQKVISERKKWKASRANFNWKLRPMVLFCIKVNKRDTQDDVQISKETCINELYILQSKMR